MKCSAVRNELSRYVEGVLPGEAQAAIAQHLATCPACRSEAEAYQRAEEALRSLAAVVPAPDLTADLRHRLSAAAPPRPLRWIWASAALAAVAAAATLLALRSLAPPAPPDTVAHRPATISGRPRATESRPQQVAIEPVTDDGVPRPTTPPHPSPAVLHRSPQPPTRVRRAHRDAPPQVPAQEVARETEEAEAQAVSLHAPTRHVERSEIRLWRTPRPFPTPDAIVLLLAAPQPALPAANCLVEVSLPDGSTSIREQVAAPDAAGEARVVRVTYQTTGPNAGPERRPQ